MIEIREQMEVDSSSCDTATVTSGNGGDDLDGNSNNNYFSGGIFDDTEENHNNTQSFITENMNATALKYQCLSEVELYMKKLKKEPPANQNPLVWWRKHCHSLPMLTQVARKWLGCLCSSVALERAFSTVGNTVTNKRANLRGDQVRDIIFLHENWHQIEF